MKKLWPLLIVAAVVVVVVVLSLRGTRSEGEEVQVEPVTTRTIASQVKASGEIVPEKKVEISAKVTGEIVELPVREGDLVQRGDLLIRIEDDLYRAARDQARAGLRQAQVSVRRMDVQLENAQRTLDRTTSLFEQGLASQQQLDDAQLAFDSAVVELDAQTETVAQAASALDRAEKDLDRTVIRSPMNGTVIQLDVEEGETVVPGTMNLPGSVLMTVAQMDSLLAEVEVGEIDVVDVELGQPAEIELDALGDETQHGEVVEIATSGREDAAQGVIRFDVKIAIDDPHPALRPAMTAKVAISTTVREDVPSVPIQAVVTRRLDDEGDELGRGAEGGTEHEAVYVLEDGEASLRQVETGASDDLYVELVEGPEIDEPVVTGPYRTLKTLHDGDATYAAEKDDEEPSDDETGDE